MKPCLLTKLFGLSIGVLLILSTNVSAMNMSQPIEIGKVTHTPPGWFEIEGATSHTGTPYTNKNYIKMYDLDGQRKKGKTIYDKGIACFGKGKEAIYFHYDAKNGVSTYNPKTGTTAIVTKFGGKDINEALSAPVAIPTCVNLIKTDSDLYIYMLVNQDPSGISGMTHTVMGKRADGKYVKYFNTYELKRQYFSKPREYHFSKNIVKGDTIILVYQWFDRSIGEYGKMVDAGEFRFKWDNSAQWFGVEQVVY